MELDSHGSVALRRAGPTSGNDFSSLTPRHPRSLDLSAGDADINNFIELYHPAVRAFIGSMVRESTAAHGLTQKFFLEIVIPGQLHRHAERTDGRFHECVKQAVRSFLIGESQHLLRQRRRASRRIAGPDDPPTGWDGVIQPTAPAQDNAFLRGLAQGIVRTALRQVFDTFKQKGRQQHFRLFVGRFLVPAGEMPSWRALGEPFALDEKTARTRAEAAARQVRATIRNLVATDGGSSETVDQQIRELISLFPES